MIKRILSILFIVFLFFALVILIIVNPVFVFKNQTNINVSKENLHKDVEALVNIDLARHADNPESLDRVADYIYKELEKLNCELSMQAFIVEEKEYRNVICRFGSNDKELIVVGAHYDVVSNLQGADDNASAVAGMLELARLINKYEGELDKQIEFVAYTLEEPPYFSTESMGSAVHVKNLLDKGEDIKLMICLEMIGYYSDKKNSQSYPAPWLNWIYPNKGDFIAVVGRFEDYMFTRKIKKAFKKSADIKTWSLNAPKTFPGIDFSDHRNYWKHDINAVMVTDTAFYRNYNYHEKTDTIDTLNFEKMSEVVVGVYYYLVNFK